MEKLSMEALNRLSLSEMKSQNKLPIVLVLDNVRSGLNVGSIFRTADAFLVSRIILCGITAQPPHREILKTALGSTESVDWVYYEDTTAALRDLIAENYAVWAVEQTSPKMWLHEFLPKQDQKYAFVLGNEVDGVDEAALALCQGAVEIPQFGTKHSLNVAVAAGVVVWEIARQIQLNQMDQ
jgi:23S rRNA (guanosine2251-2'-O)-methyltransferase